MGQSGDDFAIFRHEDDTRAFSGVPRLAAATHREKNVVLGIDGQTRRSVALISEVEMAGHLERLGIHHGDVARELATSEAEMSRVIRGAACSTAAIRAPFGPMASTLPTTEPSLESTTRRLGGTP